MASSVCIMQFCAVLVFSLTWYHTVTEAQHIYLSVTTHMVGKKS